ncbi:hypothetical protein C0993_008134, partial [Termitomyces sp. T159_Od127]
MSFYFTRRLPHLRAHFESYDANTGGNGRYAITRAYLLRQVEDYLVRNDLSQIADTVYVNPSHSGGNPTMTGNDEDFHMDVSAYAMKTSDPKQRRSLLARTVDSTGNSKIVLFKDEPVITNHLLVTGLDKQPPKNTDEMLRDSIIWAERGYHDKHPVAVRQARELKSRLADLHNRILILQGINNSQSTQDLEMTMRTLIKLEDEEKKIEQQLTMLKQIRLDLDKVKKPIRMRLMDKGMDI